ncbi:hypothetical protein OROGR_026005 [Orobanche gracilis]
MKNSVSEHSFYIDSEEEDEERVYDQVEGNGTRNDSDSSNYSSDNDNGDHRQSKPNSVNPSWPQSYRQSIDLYSSVPSPSLNFLGTPTLSRLSSSFLSSSLTRRHTPEILPSLSKPLIVDEKPKERRSSHSLLPPVPSRLKKVTDDSKVSDLHGVPVSRQCSYSQSVLNGVNVLCGVGILSTPYAVKEGGWAGLSVLVIFALLSYYTGILLRYCLDSKPGLATYPDIGQAAFGTVGRVAISIVLYVELYACCIEYVILESDNLASLFPNAHLNLGVFVLNSHHLFAVSMALAVLPTVWLRDLRILSYISAGGVIASVLVVACLFWIGLVDHVGFETKGTTILNISSLPVALGLYGYCYSGHAVFPNIYTSMANPRQYPSVLLARVVNPFTKYPFPDSVRLEELIPSSGPRSYMYSILIRTALVMSTLILGLSIPFFGLVMALIGSFLTMLVTLILPCACYLSILRGRISLFQGSMCILVIGIGIVSSAFGTYSAIAKIIQNLS